MVNLTKDSGLGIAGAILVFIIIVGVSLAVLYFFEIIAVVIAILGAICFIVIILAVIIIGIILIFALGYYSATKSPEVQEMGDYKLEDTKDSKEYDK
ncbi:MAG: hypothetical protein JSV49_05770 [Thermoplasmata archaeon]|nr:MAG: hypothetical protein JSV49_05770 [Thermoplasmata archaeon]